MNFLMSFADFFAKGGPLMWPILLCSVLALAIVLFKTLEYTTALHTLGKIKQGDSIPLPWFLAPICERLGTADEETLSLTANRQVRKLERGLGVLELITTIAPILGLTGTVTGMISTFQAIGEHGSRVDPSVLAGGIWEALITTAADYWSPFPRMSPIISLRTVCLNLSRLFKKSLTFAALPSVGYPMDIKRRKRARNSMSITPLVDVVFLLLLFFALTLHFLLRGHLRRTADIFIGKTTIGNGDYPDSNPGRVIRLNGKDVPSQSLETELASLRKIDEKQAVQVRADQEVEVGKLVAIINAIRNAGFQHFDLMTQQVNRK